MFKGLLCAFGIWLGAHSLMGQPLMESRFDLARQAPDLAQPVSLFADSAGNFWVGDAQSKRVFCFAADGNVRSVIGDKKKNKIGYPMDLFSDRNGKIYILDSQERIVLIFDPSGEHREQLGGSKTFARPNALTLDDSANVLVVDEGRKRIHFFDSFKRPIFNIETGPQGQPLRSPVTAASDRQGELFVLDAGYGSLLAYDSTRRFKQEIPLSFEGKNFSQPSDFSIGPLGEIFLLEASEPAVWYLANWRAANWRKILSGEKFATKPVALTLTSGGKLFVLDAGEMAVKKYGVKGLAEAAPSPSPVASGQKAFTTSLKDSGQLLIPFVDLEKGLAILQPFDTTGNLAHWILPGDVRLKIGGEPTAFSEPLRLAKSDIKLAIAIVWGIEKLPIPAGEELKNAIVQQIFPELDEPNDKVFIFSASAKPEVVLEAEGNTRTAELALSGLPNASGGLTYNDALLTANEKLKEKTAGLLPVIILLADAKDNLSSATYMDIARLAEEKGFANIYAVAFNDGQNGGYLSDLRRLSETTQGVYFETSEPKSFSQIFTQIIKILKYQLVVRFTPPKEAGELVAEVNLENKLLSAASSKSWIKPVYQKKEISQSSGFWKTALVLAGAMVLVLGAIFSLIFLFKKRSRKCPACGHRVEPAWSFCYFCKTPLQAESKTAKRPAAVVLQKGRLAGMRFPLNDSIMTIGASQDNAIVIDYEGISRRHARLEKNGGRWEIVDLNSTNHTYLNGKPVNRATLKNKDVVSLARVADLIFEG